MATICFAPKGAVHIYTAQELDDQLSGGDWEVVKPRACHVKWENDQLSGGNGKPSKQPALVVSGGGESPATRNLNTAMGDEVEDSLLTVLGTAAMDTSIEETVTEDAPPPRRGRSGTDLHSTKVWEHILGALPLSVHRP